MFYANSQEEALVTQGAEDFGVTPARSVLVVEDNPDGRESLRLLLELLGHHVDVAANGEEGVQKALASHPDIALVDIGLPRVDGYEVARQLRMALGTRVLLIAHTAYTAPEDRRRAREAGFDAFLAKPLDLTLLFPYLGGKAGRAGRKLR
jgi:CheY-like chemotaxis protein